MPIYMSADVAERLRAIAEDRGISRNSLVGKVLADFVRAAADETDTTPAQAVSHEA